MDVGPPLVACLEAPEAVRLVHKKTARRRTGAWGWPNSKVVEGELRVTPLPHTRVNRANKEGRGCPTPRTF